MKQVLSCLIVLLCLSCKKEKSGAELLIADSRNAFQDFKLTSHNNYVYIVFTYASIGVFADYHETKITVENGKVTARQYWGLNSSSPFGIIYTEDKTTLGSHTEGAAILTLDDIYTKAQNEWLIADPAQNTIVYETNNNGMISSCGYSGKTDPLHIFRGINIKSITAL
ncbi:MAG: hypothetical protein V4592_01810 [Bacteroidota bacterium]